MLYEVQCLKSNEDMILAFAGQLSFVQQVRGSYLHLIKVVCFLESHGTVQMDDNMGVLDFHPSTDVGLVYLTEADLVEGDTYKSKLNKLTKVLPGGKF